MLHRISGFIACIFVALQLSGCGTLGGTTINLAVDGEKSQKVSIDPIMYTGLLHKDAIQRGDFTAYRVTFPEGLSSNFHPIRLRYQVLVYGKTTGKQYDAQAIYIGYQDCDLRLAVIVDGKPTEEIVIAIANTLYTRLFTAHNTEIHVGTPEKLARDAQYRRKVVLEGGTEGRFLKKYDPRDLQRDFSGWATAQVPNQTDQLVPWKKETLDRIARINPQFTFVQKCFGVCRFGIPLPFSVWGTGIGAIEDIYMASKAPSKIWDDSGANHYEGMLFASLREQFQRAIAAGMVCSAPDVPQRRALF